MEIKEDKRQMSCGVMLKGNNNVLYLPLTSSVFL